MLVHHLHERSAGLAHAVFERARIFTDHGHRVHILTFDHLMDAEALTASFHASKRLDPRLRIENIYPLLHERAESALPLRQRFRRFRKRLRGDTGTVEEAPGRIVERNARGELLRVTDLGDDGKPARLRLYTSDQRTFLDLSFTADDAWIKKARWREGRASRSFSHQDDYLAAVLDAIIGTQHAVLIGDGIHQSHKLVRLKAPNVTRLMHLHASHLADYGNAAAGWDAPLTRLLDEHSASLDGIVTMTEEQHQLLAPSANCPVTTIPLPFSGGERLRSERDPKKAVLLGRLAPEKAIDDAIRAFALVVKELPDAQFDIWGSGREEKRLRELIGTLDLNDSVALRGWTMDPAPVLAGAAVVVNTSIGEGFGLTLVEAARQETPAVSFAVPFGPRDIISDHLTGILVADRSIESLAAGIVHILRDAEERERLGRAAAVRAEKRFAPEKIYSTWEQLWQR